MRIIDIHQHYYHELDPDGSRILAGMEKHNIERALVLAAYKTISPFVGDNLDVEEIVKRHPKKFIGGVCVNPLSALDARETIKRYHDKGFKCVKMFPDYGFYPDDPACFPVYELIIELDMLVLFHVGAAGRQVMTDQPPMISSFKYSMPCHYDTLGHAYPEMKIVLAHLGAGITLYNMSEVISLCNNHRNIYLDTSCSTAGKALEILARTIDNYVEPPEINKFVWGSDNIDPGIRLRQNREVLTKLSNGDSSIVADVFYGNAATLLGIPCQAKTALGS